MTGTPSFEVPVRRRWLLAPAALGAVLCVVSVLWQTAERRGWQPPSLQLDRALDVDDDLSVLTWMTVGAFLLAAAVALVLVAHGHRRWWWVSAGLAALSLEETVGAHAPLLLLLERQAGPDGSRLLLAAAGAVALGGLVGAVVLLRSLPPPVAWRLALVLGLLAVAAVGVDSLGPDLTDDPAARLEPWYVAKATLEEALELTAALVALDAVLLGALTGGGGRRAAEHRPRRSVEALPRAGA